MNIADDERRYYVVKCTKIKLDIEIIGSHVGNGLAVMVERFLMQHLMDLKIKDPDLV